MDRQRIVLRDMMNTDMNHGPWATRRTRVVVLLAIACAALGMRLWVWTIDPFSFEPREDSQGYHLLAKNLAEHGTLSLRESPPYAPSAFRMPGYPLFVATVYAVAGVSLKAVKFVQVLLGAALCLLTYGVGAAAFRDRRLALLAAGLVSVVPSIVGASDRLLTEALFSVVLISATWVTYLWALRCRWPYAVASGALLGGLTLVRPEAAFLPLVMVPAAWLVSQQKRTVAVQGLLTVLVSAAVVSPWIWRNHVQFGEVCLVRTGNDGGRVGAAPLMRQYRLSVEHGLLFWPERYRYLYGDQWQEAQRRYDAAMRADVQDPSQSDLMFFLQRPGDLLQCSLVRLIGLYKPVSNAELFGLADDFAAYRREGQWGAFGMKAALLVADGILILLGGVGVVLSLRPRHRFLWIITAPVLYFTSVYTLLHGIPRYRVPFMPLIVLLAVWFAAGLLLRKPQAARPT